MTRTLFRGAAIACLIFGAYVAYQIWLRPGSGGETIIEIPERASFAQILDTLKSADLIASPTAFKIYARTRGLDSKIKPGKYKFQRKISYSELLQALVEGRSSVKVKLTFPEGITIRHMASIAARQAGCDSAQFV